MILVRLLLFLALASIGVALLLWLVKRDRRYLRFVGLTLKFTLLLLLAILLWFAAERLLAPTAALISFREQGRPTGGHWPDHANVIASDSSARAPAATSG
ncbi:MAG TPA: hypothetical protein VF059_08660 [Casimicrobiaceae bacterium]